MFFLQLLTMIGFSVVQSTLVLYVMNTFHLGDMPAYAIFSAYMALIFGMSIVGGYLCELIGYRFALVISLLAGMCGLLLLATARMEWVAVGLSTYVAATAVSVPALFVLLGRLYQPQDPRRDSGFTLAYVGMNVGAFIAIFASGYVGSYLSYPIAFAAGAGFNVVALVLFAFTHQYYHPELAERGDHKARPVTFKTRTIGTIAFFLLIPIMYLLLDHADLSNHLLILIGFLSAVLIVFTALREHGAARAKLMAFWILTVVSVMFWALYMLAPSALNIFVDRNVNRMVWGHLIPTVTVQSLNPFFIMTLGPLLSLFWLRLSRRDRIFSTPAKFAFGILLMGVGYLVLLAGIVSANTMGLVAISWIVFSYLLQTIGELFVGPVGFAMVGALVPPRMEGVMMGVWQLATGVAGALSDFLANQTVSSSSQLDTPLQTNPIFAHGFTEFGLMAVGVGLLTLLLTPRLSKIMLLKTSSE